MGKREIGAASVAVLVGAVVLAVPLLGRHAAGHSTTGRAHASVQLPEPHTIVRHGVTYTVGLASPAAATTDPSDPRTVTIWATDVEQPGQPACTLMGPSAQLVAESATSVRIATFEYSVPFDDDQPRMCGYTRAVDDLAQEYRAIKVELDRPLAGRDLLDERSGKVIGVLDESYVPTPAYVPPGFAPSGLVSHFVAADSFMAMQQYTDTTDPSSLEVRIRSLTAWSRAGDVVERDDVGGHEAVVTDEGYEHCVSWSPRSGLVAEVCTLALGGGSFLPADELLRVARTIPGPTG